MIQKVIHIKNIKEENQRLDDLKFWLEKPESERISAVEVLRKQYHGTLPRLQRVLRVIKQK